MKRGNFHGRSFLFTLVLLAGWGAFVAFASPPTGGYNPGDTLNPDCAPSTTDCFVRLGISIGDNVRNGNNDSILYLDNSGNLTQDVMFTRDTTTKELNMWRTFNDAPATVTSGLLSSDDITNGAASPDTIPGTVLQQRSAGNADPDDDAIANIGVFDVNPLFGGDRATAGILSSNANYSNNLLVSATQGAWLASNDATGDSSTLVLSPAGFRASNTPAGNVSRGFMINSQGVGWQFNNTNFYLPNATVPSTGQVLRVTAVSGSDVYLGWVTPSASGLSLQTNGTPNGSQSILNLVAGTNVTLTDNGSGNVTISAAGGGGDGNIYDNNGTLAGNRVLSGNGNSLDFTGLGSFTVGTQSGNTGLAIFDSGSGLGSFVLQTQMDHGGDIHSSMIASDIDGFGIDWADLKFSLIDVNNTTTNGAAVEVNGDTGLRFRFSNGGAMDEYIFPRTDGAANQVLATDGAGQLTWIDLLPDQSTHSGQILSTNGTTAQWISNVLPSPIQLNNVDTLYSGTINAGQGDLTDGSNIFFGRNAGENSTYSESLFLGHNAGRNANGPNLGSGVPSLSIFLGAYAGENATRAVTSQFIGSQAGQNAASVTGVTCIGTQACTNVSSFTQQSVFIGYQAAPNITDASYSNFIGGLSGGGANPNNSTHANFFGYSAGNGAYNASYSVFLGDSAGSSAQNASNSIFIGKQAGVLDTVDNTGNANDYSILIGQATSTGGFKNSIALGGFAVNTASNQFVVGSTLRPITEMFVQGSGNTCTLTTGTGWSCSSDERLKTNINDLSSDTLDKIINLKTVTYNWISGDTTTQQVGFLAQNLEQYFPQLVTTDAAGYKSVYYSQMTPVLVEAIREMDLHITGLENNEKPNKWRDALIAWFGNISNGITDFFTKTSHTETLCVGTKDNETCINKTQLDSLLNGGSVTVQGPSTPPPSDNPGSGDDGSNGADPDTDITPPDNPPVDPGPEDPNPDPGTNDSGDSGQTPAE
jgi:hypothetical protein